MAHHPPNHPTPSPLGLISMYLAIDFLRIPDARQTSNYGIAIKGMDRNSCPQSSVVPKDILGTSFVLWFPELVQG